MTSRIFTVMILLVGFGILNPVALAEREPSNEEINQSLVDELNENYHNLNLSVLSDADSISVYNELLQLLDYQKKADKGQQDLTPPNLKHLTCSAPTCGGCSRGPC